VISARNPRSSHPSTTDNPCHPERSLAESEASRQTQSKDPVFADGTTGDTRNFRIVIRFFDKHESEQLRIHSREAAAWESSARKCQVSKVPGTSPSGTAPSTLPGLHNDLKR